MVGAQLRQWGVMRLNRPARRRSIMNLTPLIDVVFLLLVFFMLASTFLKFGTIGLQTEGGGAGVAGAMDTVALVHVGAGGSYRVDGRPVDVDALASALEEVVRGGKSQAVIVVREDAQTRDLAAGLAVVRRAAFKVVRVVE